MPKSKVDLNDKTTIPLWAVFSAFPAIVGAVFSFGILYSRVENNTSRMDKLGPIVIQIRDDVAFIKGQMKQFVFILPKPEKDNARAWCQKKSDDET